MAETQVFADKPKDGKPWDMIVIGSGPSAFTAAIYTTRGAASTLVFAGEKWGGQLMFTSIVDNYPGFSEGILGPDLMLKMRQQAERFGAVVLEKSVTKVDFSKKLYEIFVADKKYLAKTVVVATGALTKWLGVSGEKELIGRGVSSCAPCDAPFFKNKKVAVVGGGDTALEEVLVLHKYAKSITIIHRRDVFRASQAMQKKVLGKSKINIYWNTEVVGVIGQNKLEKLKLKNNVTNKEKEEDFDGVFVAIGHKPDSDIFKDQLKMDEKGYIIPNFHCGTSVKGVFVAGDVLDKDYKQAIVAAGSGCIAAMEALKYLEEIKD